MNLRFFTVGDWKRLHASYTNVWLSRSFCKTILEAKNVRPLTVVKLVCLCGHPRDPVTSAAFVSIVEDDDQVRKATENLILSMGWNILSFECAHAFLSSGAIERTGLLISDVTMPGMSGIEMHAQIVSQGHAPPTIFITGYPNAQDEAIVLANGALAYLEKPVESAVILQCVRQIMGEP